MRFKPNITEKSVTETEKGKYTFKFGQAASKGQIKQLIEKIFKVKVVKVNLANFSGKKRRRGRHFGRTPAYKKAIVTLKKGDTIDEFKVSK